MCDEGFDYGGDIGGDDGATVSKTFSDLINLLHEKNRRL